MQHELTCEVVTIDGRPWWQFSNGQLRPVIQGGDGPVDDDTDDDTGDDEGDDADDKPAPKDKPKSKPDKGDHDDGEAKWKSLARKHESDNKKLRKELDEARKKGMTEQEKAIAEAKAEGAREATQSVGAKLVEAEIRAQSAGRLSADARAALIDGVNHAKYLTDDGEVDEAKVKKLIDGLASKSDNDDDGKGKKKDGPDMGQGRRQGTSTPSVASGREMFEARKGARTKQ